MNHIAFVVEAVKRQPIVRHSDNLEEKVYAPSYIKLVAQALSLRGYHVDIYCNSPIEIEQHGLTFKPIDACKRKNQADVVVVHNGCRDLSQFMFKRAAVWQHNKTSLIKAWKRKELINLWRFRPDLICLSNDAIKKTPRWLPYRKKHLIPHGIQSNYLSAANPTINNRKMRAYFASRPSRNLDFVISAWANYVHPVLPEAELIICCPKSHKPFPFNIEALKQANIQYLGHLSQKELIELGASSRMLCYPGHPNETGCRVALDAIGLGLPIITAGIGSLKDLVTHKKSGFIETEPDQYAMRIIECMKNDMLWKNLSKATRQHPWRQSYNENAHHWDVLLTD